MKLDANKVKSYQPHLCIQGNERMNNNSCLSSVHARRDTKISPHSKGPFRCYVTFFYGKLDLIHPLVILITLNLTSS